MPAIPRLSIPITDHQDLLARYVRAEQSVISEWSGDFFGDTGELRNTVHRYAHANELAIDPEWFQNFERDYEEYQELYGKENP